MEADINFMNRSESWGNSFVGGLESERVVNIASRLESKVQASGMDGKFCKLSTLKSNKRSFGFKHTNLPINLLIINGFYSKHSALSICWQKKGGEQILVCPHYDSAPCPPAPMPPVFIEDG